jgi:hypothetical protein
MKVERYFRQPTSKRKGSTKIKFHHPNKSTLMAHQQNKGLQFGRRFTKEGTSPFDQFEYDYRTSIIRNPNGEVVFEMNNVEVPKQWSQIATDILAQKYFRKAGVPHGQLLESLG